MSTWKGKTRGGVLGYRIFIFFLKNVGLSSAYFILRFVAFYFVLFAPKATRWIYFYFHDVLGYSFLRSSLSIYRNYYIFGQTLLDKVAMLSGFKTDLTFELDGEEHLETMSRTTGGILISAHIGNWQVAGNFLNRLEGAFSIVMYEAEHEKIKQQLEEIQVKKKMNIIVVKDDLSHVYAINNALKNNELVIMHGDRFVEGSKTIHAEFLGKKARFPSGPFYLISKFKVNYSFVYAMKESNKHYHFYASPPKIHEGPVEDLMDEYVQSLEKMIAIYPEQWYNYYDFWEDSNATLHGSQDRPSP